MVSSIAAPVTSARLRVAGFLAWVVTAVVIHAPLQERVLLLAPLAIFPVAIPPGKHLHATLPVKHDQAIARVLKQLPIVRDEQECSLKTALGGERPMTAAAQQELEPLPDRVVVVDDEDLGHGGRRTG